MLKFIQTVCLVATTGTVVLAFGETARDNFLVAVAPDKYISVERNRIACDEVYSDPRTKRLLAQGYAECVSAGAHWVGTK